MKYLTLILLALPGLACAEGLGNFGSGSNLQSLVGTSTATTAICAPTSVVSVASSPISSLRSCGAPSPICNPTPICKTALVAATPTYQASPIKCTPAPEPCSMLGLGFGIAGVLARRRKAK